VDSGFFAGGNKNRKGTIDNPLIENPDMLILRQNQDIRYESIVSGHRLDAKENRI